MAGVTKFRALPMRMRRSSKLRGSSGRYTLSFTKPHNKNSHASMSGDLGGGQGNITLSLVPAQPIQRLGITLLRNFRTSSLKTHYPDERRNHSTLLLIAGKARSVTYQYMCWHSLLLML
ncbi:hypothetical protein AVEN_230086-1 [Araneus ventricosus]|uniref:Uncharacterized protein n=1 Tax=Araneus ventricosus TaxID=182803 RepID=A0A4Y2GY55_ARAVE|nr:hypothetical protein AVEN_230086-1 [Araneus ventricosus]